MKAAVLAGLIFLLTAAVVAFAVGLVLAGYAAIGCGVLWLALEGERARPSPVGTGREGHRCPSNRVR